MSDLQNCVERYERKFGSDAIVNNLPTMHFAEIICTELRKAEKKIVENSINMQTIEYQTEMQNILNLLKE